MENQGGGQKAGDSSKKIQAIFIAAIIVSLAVVGYVVYVNSQASNAGTYSTVASGDSVTLNYIGTLPDGRVFDTSLLNVATDNAAYPKSLNFNLRSNDSYQPFTMTAGNYGEGGTIKGFALGVIGMKVNETRIVEIPPGEGYALNPAMLKTIPLVQQINATEVFSINDFSSNFGVEPSLLSVIPHYFWGWDVTVTSISGNNVTIKHMPVEGKTYYPYGDPNSGDAPAGWPVVVDSFDGSASGGVGITTVRNVVKSSDVYNVKGTDSDGAKFVIWSYDSVNSTFTIHKSNSSTGYNAEISGRTLFFQITVISVKAASS